MGQVDFRTYHIAKLYYIDHKKQNDIAQMLGISNMLVSRILKKAEAEKIVVFQVQSPNRLDWEAGNRIKQKYPHLKECFVVQVDPHEDGRTRLASVAADYIGDLFEDGTNIGVSWGQTLCKLARILRGGYYPNMHVLQMSGGFLCDSDVMMMPANIIQRISERMQGKAMYLNAPLFAPTADVAHTLRQDALFQCILDRASNMHISLYGVSRLNKNNTMKQVGALNEEDLCELESKGAIGDIMGCFIDAEGKLVEWAKKDCYMGVSLETAAQATHAICLAGETDKAPVMHLAMEKGFCNTAIISDQLAQILLK